MARTLLLFVALVLALPARAEDTPMVWAFQHFCADETFTLDEARLAIAVAGGKQRSPTASTNFPNPMSITFWDIMIDGHKIGISLGSTRAQAAAGGAADLVSCAVYADGSDETGAAQLQKWAGVAPIPMPGGGAETYRFISDGGRHIPISNDAGGTDGRAWQVIVANGSFANVTLMRFLKMRESR